MSPSPVFPVLTIVVGVGTVLVATRGQRGPLLSPISTTMFILVSIFGLRPIFAIVDDMHLFYGVDTESGFNGAARLGFVSVVALSVGYFVARRSNDEPTREVARAASVGTLQPAAALGMCMVLAWALAVAFYGGGPSFVVELFRGRSPDSQAALSGMPLLVSTLPTSATVVVSAARIVVERTRPLVRGEVVAFWGAVAVSCVPPLALGNRRFLIPSLLAAGLAVAIPRWRQRVSLRAVVLAAVAVLLLVVIPNVRSEGSRHESDDLIGAVADYLGDEGISGALSGYFLSYDTEMFGYVAYMHAHLGDDLDYGYGRWTFGDAVLAPLPATFADRLELQMRSDEVMSSILGEGCTTRSCPVPSLTGVLLSDFGEPGVALGFFVVGLLIARFGPGLRSATGGRLVWWITLGGAAPALVRGNTVNQAWLTLNIVAAAAIGLWWWRRASAAGGDSWAETDVDQRPASRLRPLT